MHTPSLRCVARQRLEKVKGASLLVEPVHAFQQPYCLIRDHKHAVVLDKGLSMLLAVASALPSIAAAACDMGVGTHVTAGSYS